MTLFAPIETKAKKGRLIGCLFDQCEQTASKASILEPKPAQVGRYFGPGEHPAWGRGGDRWS
jgi:hypothetical protein